MKTTSRRGKPPVTELSEADQVAIGRLLRELGPHAHVPRLNGFKQHSSDDLWWMLVQQVCVMGSARGVEALERDPARLAAAKAATSLRELQRRSNQPGYLPEYLRAEKLTRFYPNAARTIHQLRQTPSAVRGIKVTLLDDLPELDSVDALREEIMARCPLFRRKSASDFMITVGLSHDVIALDQRVVGVLERHLGYNLSFDRLQRNKALYLSVESALRAECHAVGSSLAVLDRTIFQFEGSSAAEFVLRYRTAA